MGDTIRRLTRRTPRSDQRPRARRDGPPRFAIAIVGSLATVVLVLAAAGTALGAKPSPTPPQSFGVTGLAANAAGTVQTIKVTALTSGKPNPSYRGAVVLTSTDGQAVLPVQYQFTSADKGAHSFAVQLKTAGPQAITATDTADTAIRGSQTTSVTPADAATFSLSSLSGVTAGTTQNLTLTVRDAFGNLATTYRGTVHALSSDAQAALPADYGFTAADAGVHAFTVALKTVGQQAVSLTDTSLATLTATAGPVSVTPANAASLVLAGLADHVAGVVQSISVTAQDAYGNTATGYRGTVAFASTDPQATLPGNHAFTASEAGFQHFDVTLKTAGSNQAVTVTDTTSAALTSSQAVTTSNGPAADLAMTTNVVASFHGEALVTAGQPFALTVRVVDAYGNTAVDYVGQITIGSTETGLLGVPLATVYDYGATDAGSKTLSSFVLREKHIYDEHTTISATDQAHPALSAGMDFQVLPGPAVRYSACGPAYSASSGYQQVIHPIGVNDPVGFYVDALDAYGNVATNRQPSNPLLPALPTGYEASAPIVTSDAQALFFNRGAIALFTGSRNAIGPQVEVRLRTAGDQDITVTDPINPALTTTCSYRVAGPQAFNGTLHLADPKTTGNTVNNLPLSSYLPPNDSGYVVESLVGPTIGVTPLGTVAASSQGLPYVRWDLDPADAPGPVIRCDTQTACTVGPIQFTYRIRDAYGNVSDGSFTVSPWNASIGGGNMVYSGDGQLQVVGYGQTPLNAQLSGIVIGVRPGEASIRVGDAVMDVAMPTGSTLALGTQLSVNLSRPLVVSGTTPDCVPDVGTVCEKASFVAVTLIPVTDPSGVPASLSATQTMGTDMCGFFSDAMTACPDVLFHIANPPPGSGLPDGSGFPAAGMVGFNYHFQFLATSSQGEAVTFSLTSGTHLPAGLTLHPDGLIDGVATTAQLVSFQVVATGTVSGATSSAEIFTIAILP